MEIHVALEDVARELSADSEQLLDLLALLAGEDTDGYLVDRLAAAHSGSLSHCAILPWLCRLVVALGQVETADAAVDAAGLVS